MLITETQEHPESNTYNNTKASISSSTRKQAIDPLLLDTVGLAAYLLGILRRGATTEQLVQSLGGNYSLAGAYLKTFQEFGWIEKDEKNGKWVLTPLGEAKIPRFQET